MVVEKVLVSKIIETGTDNEFIGDLTVQYQSDGLVRALQPLTIPLIFTVNPDPGSGTSTSRPILQCGAYTDVSDRLADVELAVGSITGLANQISGLTSRVTALENRPTSTPRPPTTTYTPRPPSTPPVVTTPQVCSPGQIKVSTKRRFTRMGYECTTTTVQCKPDGGGWRTVTSSTRWCDTP